MGALLVILGGILVTTAARGEPQKLWDLVAGDFAKGEKDDGFGAWFAAFLLIGSVGYIPALRNVSRAFLVLVFIVLIVVNRGLFQSLQQQMNMQAGTKVDGSSGNVIDFNKWLKGFKIEPGSVKIEN